MIKQDYKHYGLSIKGLIRGWFTGHGFYAVLYYRIGNWFVRHHIGFLPDYMHYRGFRRFGSSISSNATIGPGFTLHHTLGIVIGYQVVAGSNFEVFQNVTIGSNRKPQGDRYMPIIGDNVTIGAGAVVVGAITIGNNVIIGANSYVAKDVPDNVMVAGIPAKIIKHL